LKSISRATLKGRAIPVAVLLILTILLSVGSGLYAGASFFAQQAPNVTITTTIFTTTTSWTTSTIWSTVTSVVEGIWTTVQYTTSTSTVTVTGFDTYTKLLLHMDGTDGSQTFVDSSPQAHVVTVNANARISTAQSEFGGASGLFDGSASLSTPDSPDWYFGTGDFTIDFWVRFNALPSNGNSMSMFAQTVDLNSLQEFEVKNVGGTYVWRYVVNSGGSQIIAIENNSLGLATNTWYHVALVRSGTSFMLFQSGTQCGRTVTNAYAVPDFASNARIGAMSTTARFFNGWLDEYRISKGVARWTSNFPPPTAPY